MPTNFHFHILPEIKPSSGGQPTKGAKNEVRPTPPVQPPPSTGDYLGQLGGLAGQALGGVGDALGNIGGAGDQLLRDSYSAARGFNQAGNDALAASYRAVNPNWGKGPGAGGGAVPTPGWGNDYGGRGDYGGAAGMGSGGGGAGTSPSSKPGTTPPGAGGGGAQPADWIVLADKFVVGGHQRVFDVYAKDPHFGGDPHEATMAAIRDDVWGNAARTAGVLTGNADVDTRIWNEHYDAVHNGGRDPLEGHPGAVQAMAGAFDNLTQQNVNAGVDQMGKDLAAAGLR